MDNRFIAATLFLAGVAVLAQAIGYAEAHGILSLVHALQSIGK